MQVVASEGGEPVAAFASAQEAGAMGLFDHLEDAFNVMTGGGDRDMPTMEQEPNRVHELLAGGAAFAAMRQYEAKREREGYHDHATARELLAAFTGAEVDKMIETRGLNEVDAERAKRDAYEQANQMYESKYAGQQEGGYAAQREGYGEGYAAQREGYGEGYGGREGYAPRREEYGGGYERREGYGGGYEGGKGYGGGYEGQRGGGYEGGEGYGQREGYNQGY